MSNKFHCVSRLRFLNLQAMPLDEMVLNNQRSHHLISDMSNASKYSRVFN
ncbi:MAG: hypothetical protein AAGF83_28080 [Cyanobacteria bacterium P01_G01_bin.67]